MYKFRYYGSDLHIPGSDDCFLLSPVINMGAGQSWTVSAKIYDQHPNFLKLKTLKYGLEVYKNDRLISRCRLMQLKRTFNNTYQLFAEDKLAVLNDSQCRPYEFTGTPEELFDWFLENHNTQVSEEQQLKKGRVTVTDPNDYIARSWEQTLDTWSLMNSRLVEPLGGFLVVRYEEDGDYLDWIKEFSLYSEQSIRFGENLLDLNTVIDAAETYTACIPYGAEIEDEENSGKRVTVESVNDGKDYIINENMAREYGVVYAPTDLVTWDDVTRPENLLTKATNWLNNEGVMLLETMEFTAADLAVAGIDINSFEMYQNVLVESTPHNINTTYLISGMKVAADLSEVIKITVGDTKRTLSAQLAKNKGEGSLKTVQGKPGAAGKSAYDIWLEAGNTGTEEDYLASLKGEKGDSIKGDPGVSVESVTRYYLLQSSELEIPSAPTEYPPPAPWTTTEPSYEEESMNSLYLVDHTLFSNGEWGYSDVSLSSSYEAAKSAYNKAQHAEEQIVEQASRILQTAEEVTMGILAGYTTTSDLETYKKEIENLFSASEEGFSMEFNQLSERLDDVGREVRTQSEYIRFKDGVIYIGKSDSFITAEFTNDELRFIYNGHPVATFTSEALKVNSIYIENQLSYFDKWATRKGAYIEGKGYNLTDMWIGG